MSPRGYTAWRKVLLLLVGLLIAGALSSVGAEFAHGPYSGAPSRDSVVISWLTEAVVPARIEYDLLPAYEASGVLSLTLEVQPLEPDPLHETTHVHLQELEPSAGYAYRVILIQSGSETVSPTGAFSTAPEAGEPVTFAVLADTQQQLEGTNRLALVCGGIAADEADFDFILHGGDIVESPSSFYWDDWFASFGSMLLRAPLIPVLGNHEKNHRSYYDVFELPPGEGKNDERWWALHWGDVVVVGLDSNANKANEFKEQQAWAREHLSGSEPHKFVIFHHPVFSSDAYHGTGYFFDSIYHPIFVELDVDIVFNGHSHHYEHIVRDGVTYLVVGGGGATPRKTTPEHIQGSDVSAEGHHFYVRVHTDSGGIRVETVSIAKELPDGECAKTGELIDSFVLGEAELPEPTTVLPWWVVVIAVLAVGVALAVIRRARK